MCERLVKMEKTNAEKQRAYRERMKARLGEEFLKKERERVKKARTPAALLNKKELAVRRNVSVNSNWVHPPGQPPGIRSKKLPGGSGFDF